MCLRVERTPSPGLRRPLREQLVGGVPDIGQRESSCCEHLHLGHTLARVADVDHVVEVEAFVAELTESRLVGEQA